MKKKSNSESMVRVSKETKDKLKVQAAKMKITIKELMNRLAEKGK